MKIVITAGPTREFIDPVRFISNPSTGKIGYLIAEKLKSKGHSVTLISGPSCLKPPEKVKIVNVISAEDMKREVLGYFPECDILIMSSAVGDWKPEIKSNKKLKRKKEWYLKLIPNPDILKEVSKIKKKNQIIIGFALETENIKENALKKLKGKKLDLIIADTPGFFGDSISSKVIFISKDEKIEEFEKISKEEVAEKIVKWINFFLSQGKYE
ncbi:MAG TPA: phosphopantothenoylcysteine decarboxylase [bacterium]|nr:phosphopantothenoylcysteine decarboxylase [bacterium]